MSPIKQLSTLFLSLVMFSFASCEVNEVNEVEPLSASSTQESKYGESKFANIYTDRETTDLVWNLHSVTVDGVDYTAQYVRKERSGYTDSYLDIRRDGAFVGILLTHNNTGVGTGAGTDTETPLEWKLMGNKINLFESYGLETLTETELVLSLTQENSPVTFDGEVMTFRFIKEEKNTFDKGLLTQKEDWRVISYILDGEEHGPSPVSPLIPVSSLSFNEDGTWVSDGLFLGFPYDPYAPLTWTLKGDQLILENSSGGDSPNMYCTILSLTESELVMDIRRGDEVFRNVVFR